MTEIVIGLVAVALAAIALVGVVRELASRVGLNGLHTMLLAGLLGMGVLAFTVKLVAVVVLEAAPVTLVQQQISPPSQKRTEDNYVNAESIEPIHYVWRTLPKSAPAPADNPTTPAKARLGERLFHDVNLSADRDISCASCHDLMGKSGADGRRVSQGTRGLLGHRNAPTVWNSGFQALLFWDGRAATLEEQAIGPITNPAEMGMASVQHAVDRIATDESYRIAFAQAFNDQSNTNPVTSQRLLAALASFERPLVSTDTPYDRFVRGEDNALGKQQLQGMALFAELGCVHCHRGANFSGASIFDLSAPYRVFPAILSRDLEHLGLLADKGRAPATSRQGVWRIPSLRNVELTAPYFHNGSVNSLEEAVRIMAKTQLGLKIDQQIRSVAARQDTGHDPGVTLHRGRTLTIQDIDAIVAFLRTLSSDRLVSTAR